jgi:activator of 2-hydroxyglutaryl-CoA dehydratase
MNADTVAKYIQLELFKEKELPLDDMPTHLTNRELYHFMERSNLNQSQIINVMYTVAVGNYMTNPYKLALALANKYPTFKFKSWHNTSSQLNAIQRTLNKVGIKKPVNTTKSAR